jgi:hypothetical protein
MTTPSAREALSRLIELDEQAPTGFEIGTDPQWTSDWYQAIHQARQALAPDVAISGEQWTDIDGPHAWRPMPAPLTAAPWVVLEPPAPAPTTGTAMTPKTRTDAAQAVYQAAHNAWVTKDDPEHIAAAALRAAADRTECLIGDTPNPKFAEGVLAAAHLMDLIATELEGHHG